MIARICIIATNDDGNSSSGMVKKAPLEPSLMPENSG
jgi:hypothetical protein